MTTLVRPRQIGIVASWQRVAVNPSFQLGRLMVLAGVVLVALGLLLMAGSKFSFFGLGRLPGDIVYKGRNTSFYFPIVTCVIVSIVLTLLFWLVSFLTRK